MGWILARAITELRGKARLVHMVNRVENSARALAECFGCAFRFNLEAALSVFKVMYFGTTTASRQGFTQEAQPVLTDHARSGLGWHDLGEPGEIRSRVQFERTAIQAHSGIQIRVLRMRFFDGGETQIGGLGEQRGEHQRDMAARELWNARHGLLRFVNLERTQFDDWSRVIDQVAHRIQGQIEVRINDGQRFARAAIVVQGLSLQSKRP